MVLLIRIRIYSNEAVEKEKSKFDFRHVELGVLVQYFGENVKQISQSYTCLFVNSSCSQLIKIIQ